MWNKLFRYIDDKWPIKARYKRFATKVCVTYSGIRSVEWTISLLWTVYSDKIYRAFFRDVTAAILESQRMKPVSNKVLYWVRPCFFIINCKYTGPWVKTLLTPVGHVAFYPISHYLLRKRMRFTQPKNKAIAPTSCLYPSLQSHAGKM